MWLTKKQAATRIAISISSLRRRHIPWQESPAPFKVRYKELVLNQGGSPLKRYYGPDVDAFLQIPARSRRGRKPKHFDQEKEVAYGN